ncbi:MAG: guanylate kinase [Planctomycetota bacterium]|nr:MAG: guanylate kinase [Planctomycetota bacterium]
MVVVISGPSGVGKTTIVKRLLERLGFLRLSVSATTRAPRPGEKNGVDYHFVSREEFEKMVNNKQMLEWTQVYGNYYGTPISEIENAQKDGKVLLLDIEIDGVEQLRSKGIKGVYIQIVPPSIEELRRRLQKRGTESREAVERRLKRAAEELAKRELFDFVVENDDLERAVNEVERIVREHIRRSRNA